MVSWWTPYVWPSVHCLSVFSFQDDNLNNCQWIFNKIGMGIHIVEIWVGIANGQILSESSVCHMIVTGYYCFMFLFFYFYFFFFCWIIMYVSEFLCSFMICMLGKSFSKQRFRYFVLFFPENRLWLFMQIVSLGDNLHEISKPVLGKNKKTIVFVICWICPESGNG